MCITYSFCHHQKAKIVETLDGGLVTSRRSKAPLDDFMYVSSL